MDKKSEIEKMDSLVKRVTVVSDDPPHTHVIYEKEEEHLVRSEFLAAVADIIRAGRNAFRDANRNPVSASWIPMSAGWSPLSAGWNPMSAGWSPMTAWGPTSAGWNLMEMTMGQMHTGKNKSMGSATPELEQAFNEWVKRTEGEALKLIGHGAEDAASLANGLKISERSARFIIGRLAEHGKINLKVSRKEQARRGAEDGNGPSSEQASDSNE